MKAINKEQVQDLGKQAACNKKVLAGLRLGSLLTTDWGNLDFFVLFDKTQRHGLLFYEIDQRLMAFPYTMTPKKPRRDGRHVAVICDLCKTWRRGGSIGLLTLTVAGDKHRLVGCYACRDLNCSLHVRDLTSQATLSRTQLREDMEPAERIARLDRNLQDFLKRAQKSGHTEVLLEDASK